MKRLAAILRAAADRANPIVVKELRQAVRSRFVIAVLLLFLLINLFGLGAYVVEGSAQEGARRAGRDIFLLLFGILLGTTMVLVPLYAGLRLSLERGGGNMDLLYATSIRPAAIIRGKFWAAGVVALLIYSACMPFLSFTYLLRGIDLPSIFFLLGIALVATAVCVTAGLFAGCMPGMAIGGLVGAAVLVGLGYALAGMIALSVEFLSEGGASLMGVKEFWAVVGTGLLEALAAIAVLQAFCVAMISPRASNRTLRIRLALTAVWLVNGVLAALWSHSLSVQGPVSVWAAASMCLVCVALPVGVSEADHWSPRVARTIPRRLPLRAPALLMYCGSAGGVLWCLALAGATVVLAHALAPPSRGWVDLELGPVLRAFGGVFLYVLCYCLTAVAVRQLFPGIPTYVRGMLAGLLAVAACLLPPLAAWLLDPKGWGDLMGLWMIGNPFILGMRQHRDGALTFATVWAVAAFAACLPWLVGQVSRFRPYRSAAPSDG